MTYGQGFLSFGDWEKTPLLQRLLFWMPRYRRLVIDVWGGKGWEYSNNPMAGGDG